MTRQRDEHGKFTKNGEQDVIDAEVINDIQELPSVGMPQVDLAIIEPAPWLVDDLFREAIESRDEGRVLSALTLVEKWYPSFHEESGERTHHTVHNLGEDYAASLRTRFAPTIEEQIERKFGVAVDHVIDDHPLELTLAQKQALY